MSGRFIGFLLFFLAGLMVAKAEPVSRHDVLAAIAVLERDVTSADAFKAAETVTRFGKESTAVTIIVGPETLPWVQPDVSEAEATVRAMLMAVYFAGDIKSQLEKHRPEADPYSGWKAVIKAYRQLRQKQPDLVIPEIETLIQKDQAGTLKQEADALRRQQEQNKEEPYPRPRNLV